MRRSAVKIFSLAILFLVIGMSGCGEGTPPPKPSEGRLEKMKPKKGDSLSKLMERDWNNIEYIMYGFINYDTEKIKTATGNLVALSSYMLTGITPAYMEHKAEWGQQCSAIRNLAGDLKREFEQQNFDESRNNFFKLTKNCMDCHKLYRKYLKPKLKLSAAQLEAMQAKDGDSLSNLMDRNWDNLRYMMYGFINYDDVRMKTTTENLVVISNYMAKKISPEHMSQKAAWNEQCDRQQALANNIGREFEQKNFEESQNQIQKLIANCMECHKLYRKHLIKAEN